MPKTLMDVVRDIRKSPSKIQAVREIGFGEVVYFSMDELPLKLAFWLVNNFDETTCELALPVERPTVTQDDVQTVFDIPKGSQTLSHDLKRAILTKGLVAKWREHHGTTKALISTMQIKQKIVEDEEAGLGFKLDFLVLFCDRVIESNTNNFVKHSFLNSISNVDMIADINWCQYMIDVIVDFKKEWLRGDRKVHFRGPILLLLISYMYYQHTQK
uniref:Uncharacterized protein n=1 Tax=Kalanchoe fedtschenkoi TaxID=63787 RepID=A0A7N0UFU4_KALFE